MTIQRVSSGMTAIVFCRKPPRALVSFRIGYWTLRTSDRGGPPVIGEAVENPPPDHQTARLRRHRLRLCNAGGARWNSSLDWTSAWTRRRFAWWTTRAE